MSTNPRTAKLAAFLAYLAAAGHPSLAPTWHALVWPGRARPRRPATKTRPAFLVPAQPATRRSRRAR